MAAFIPYGRQNISQQDIDAVVSVLTSDWLTQGPMIDRFERAVADYCGVRYAVAVSSATAALHIACMAAGLNVGDRLWTSPNTFVASANCGLYCGAGVDFVDIDPHTYNLDVRQLEQKLAAQANNSLPKVVVPVHFAGQSCDMATIATLAQRYSFTVIEDASHAIGARYRGRLVGCCDFSDMAVFSFHPVKIITTGEGGMVLTNQTELYEKLVRLRSHGITRNPEHMEGESHGPWYYQQLELGFNYRMTDFQAVLGVSQMERLSTFVERRRLLAERYHEQLADLPVRLPLQISEAESSWHLYVIRLRLDQIRLSYRQVFEALREKRIGVNLHYIPVHTQPYYQNLGFKWGEFPEAEKYYLEAISLPLYFGLTKADQEWVVSTLKQVIEA